VAVVKAVIDTNIWVSSLLNPFGFPAKLRKAFEEGDFNVVISVPMLEELSEVLNRPRIKDKFEIEDADIIGLLTILEDRAEDVRIAGDILIRSLVRQHKMSFPLVGNLSFPEGLRIGRNDRKEYYNVALLIAVLVTICRDKDDDIVIETAIKGLTEYLVTRDDDIKFDKKISSFLSRHGVTVISLSKFLDTISKT